MSCPSSTKPAQRPYELVTRHSLLWLVVANGVGLWLATLLLVPELGDLLAPLSYGRWVPVHLDLQLYGWCSLPLVGLLLRLYLPSPRLPAQDPGPLPAVALGLWSASLAFGAVWWLAGGSSGKLFLEWSGPSRLLLSLVTAFLALALALVFRRRLRQLRDHRSPESRLTTWGKGALLALLATVPAVLFFAASPAVYPAVNPDSGGATGWSLLGSTLGIVTLFWGLPFALGLRARDGGRVASQTLILLGLHFLWFALVPHGDRSNHDPAQIVALSSLVVWPPLLARHLRCFPWRATSRRWLGALAAWSVVLVLSGVVGFLPGVLEAWKFTNALVAHAHAAMAGVVTCLCVVILDHLGAGTAVRDVFSARLPFWAWQGGCAVYVGSMFVLGSLEGADPGLLFRGDPAVTWLYGLRWIAGAAMFTASWAWLAATRQRGARARAFPVDVDPTHEIFEEAA